MAKTTLSGSTRIGASPDTVYAMVSDLPRMGEWSPEAQGGEWVGGGAAGGPTPGSKFKGTNGHGGKTWTTTVTVTDATAPRRFAFRNGVGPLSISIWEYDITPTEDGCEVTETWTLTVPAGVMKLGKLVTGVDDRVEHTRSMIDTTLARLKESAEAQG
jgi:hypothetical protein